MSSENLKHFKQGTRIITKGEQALFAYMIIKGAVTVFLDENTKRLELARLGEGEIFGETAILSHGHYGAHVEAASDCTLLIITPQSLQDMLDTADPMLQSLVEMLMRRLKATNDALLKSETREFMDLGFI